MPYVFIPSKDSKVYSIQLSSLISSLLPVPNPAYIMHKYLKKPYVTMFIYIYAPILS